MSRKKKHPEHENLERWLVSYADFITLLFATFTALYALAQNDQAKLKDVAEAIREGFSEQSILNGIQSILQGKSSSSQTPDPISSKKGEGAGVVGKYESMTYSPGDVKRLKESMNDLKKSIGEMNQAIQKGAGGNKSGGVEGFRGVELAVQERGIRVSFDSSFFFEPGSAVLRPEAQQALGKVGENLRKLASSNLIHVEGHTDDQPVFSALYPSNWELSTARSSSVVRFLIQKQGFDAVRMAAVGYADSRPITSNKTEAGRRRNRRIDIIIYGQLIGRQIDPRTQFQKEEVLVKAEEPAKNDNQIIKSMDDDTQTGGALPPSNIHHTDSFTPVRVVPDDLGKVSPIVPTKKPANSEVKTPH